MTFLTDLKVKPIRGTTKRELLCPFQYKDKQLGVIEVPKGFITDYATIPLWVPRWILDDDGPTIRGASVIHDYIYSDTCNLPLTRKQADSVLYRAMRDAGSSYFNAKTTYFIVRLFGRTYWNNYTLDYTG